ncbi:MAG: HAMP domain-containing histidine kinase [Lachnospiraceae bacterium]|nr:HAMP domain-containing histidine kinase [Lachnospiraceae bacterium]
MKLYGKLFLGMMVSTLLAFALFGVWVLNANYQTSLNREKERSFRENQMYQYAFLTALQNLPEEQINDENAASIAESIWESMGNERNVFRIYNSRRKAIYEKGDYVSGLVDIPLEESESVSQISDENGRYYLEALFYMEYEGNVYYMERNVDVSYIYEDRQRLYGQYRVAILITFCAVAVWALLFAHGLTKPIRDLSRVTERFAKGDYSSRAKPKGHDEVAELIGDFNHMADRLEQSMEELRMSARRQEDFTAAFAHELKTPLTSIIGYADMLRMMDMNEEERLTSADYIYQQGKRLERLSHKLLELIGMDKQDVAFRLLDVEELAGALRQMTAKLLEEKRVTLIFRMDPGQVCGDRDLLLSLFGNIIDNARKACREGGHIWVRGKAVPGSYQVIFLDDGVGMPKEELSRVTEAFYMVDKSRARKEGGSGIGLALCGKIVELHQGKWYMDSEPGKGTGVLVVLPDHETTVGQASREELPAGPALPEREKRLSEKAGAVKQGRMDGPRNIAVGGDGDA